DDPVAEHVKIVVVVLAGTSRGSRRADVS
ncbi:hypothetical protein Q604_UNBC11696G0001, partial [human gut metagenome]